VTGFNHSILFFFAIALALLCTAVMMLYLDMLWNDATFVTLVATALVVSLVLPAIGAVASLRFLRWRQPLAAWLVFYALTAGMALLFGRQLL